MHINQRLAFSKDYLMLRISPEHTILLHGGGNLGDLYRRHTNFRNYIIKLFPNNKLVMFGQTLNYRNLTLAALDNQLYSTVSDLSMMLRSFDSLQSARLLFPKTRTILIPDTAFMIGDMPPKRKPIVDILVLARKDFESQASFAKWTSVVKAVLKKKQNVTFKVSNFFVIIFINLLNNGFVCLKR